MRQHPKADCRANGQEPKTTSFLGEDLQRRWYSRWTLKIDRVRSTHLLCSGIYVAYTVYPHKALWVRDYPILQVRRQRQ